MPSRSTGAWSSSARSCSRFLFKRYKKTEKGRDAIDAVKLRVPVFGSLFHKTALSRFSSTLAMLLRAGVPILQALDIVADTVNNKVIVQGGRSTCRPASAKVSRSRSRSRRHAVFPPMVVQMIAVGEETGQVDTMLDKVAQFYDQEVEAAVDALTSLIEPLLIADHRRLRRAPRSSRCTCRCSTSSS